MARAAASVQLFVAMDDVAAVVSKAETIGARLLIAPTTLPEGGEIAVMHDPQGMLFVVKICPNERQCGTWDAFFWVRDGLALHERTTEKRGKYRLRTLIQDAYRMQEFAIRDTQGYVLGFGQPLALKSP